MYRLLFLLRDTDSLRQRDPPRVWILITARHVFEKLFEEMSKFVTQRLHYTNSVRPMQSFFNTEFVKPLLETTCPQDVMKAFNLTPGTDFPNSWSLLYRPLGTYLAEANEEPSQHTLQSRVSRLLSIFILTIQKTAADSFWQRLEQSAPTSSATYRVLSAKLFPSTHITSIDSTYHYWNVAYLFTTFGNAMDSWLVYTKCRTWLF